MGPPALVSAGDEASARAIADEVGFEPAGLSVLTARSDQSIGNEYEGASEVRPWDWTRLSALARPWWHVQRALCVRLTRRS